MKLFVIFVVAGMAFAFDSFPGESSGVGYLLPGTDDVFDSYAYKESEVFSSVPAAYSEFAVCDDFTATGSGDVIIDTYTSWGFTTGSNPAELELLVIADNSGPDGAPVSQTSYPCTLYDSGFTYAGYTVWVTVMDLSSDPAVVMSGETVWFGHHRNDGGTWAAGCGTTVTGSEGYRTVASGWAWAPFSESLESGDIFKIVEGSTSLERSTWAGIKNMF
ncbi:MAG: hypothetical protein K8S62_04835 [Candidatus Sabulitectum sp.]|nr:hypothetical protein [Candidatus Sabulitectum sp.]